MTDVPHPAAPQTHTSAAPAPRFPLPDADGTAVTRFGATATDLHRAAGTLRAWAGRSGVELCETSDIDLAAAVVAADAWLWVLRSTSFTRAATHGPGAVAALAATLARAAGHRLYVVGETLEDVSPMVDPDAIELCEHYRRWAGAQLGAERAAGVLRRAGADLAAGRDQARAGRELDLARLGALLDVSADTYPV
jgi:hypothetical protein